MLSYKEYEKYINFHTDKFASTCRTMELSHAPILYSICTEFAIGVMLMKRLQENIDVTRMWPFGLKNMGNRIKYHDMNIRFGQRDSKKHCICRLYMVFAASTIVHSANLIICLTRKEVN